jgi:hypothetical protein
VEAWFTMANDLEAINEKSVEPDHDFWVNDSLGPAAMAIALGQKERGLARLDHVVRGIHDWRAQRAERFRKNDPHGTAVLAKAHFMVTGRRTRRFAYDKWVWSQILYY